MPLRPVRSEKVMTFTFSGGSFGGANRIVYLTAANTFNALPTTNNAVLVTDGSGVPSLSTALPPVDGSALINLPSTVSATEASERVYAHLNFGGL
jgi:hypothetical protein